ncbi:MAG: Calx-beta domain-containing protein [Pyrinomonadaceae bacterium]
MPTLPLKGRRRASARRQMLAVLTVAFLLFQQGLLLAPAAHAQALRPKAVVNTTATKTPANAPVTKAPAPTLDDPGGPNDTGTGSISLATAGSAVTENFNTLSNTAGSTTNTALPTGWYITETGGGARDNEQYAVDTGGSTTGDIYSYGSAAATDRALGELRSGTLIPLFGAKFTNNTGSTITSLDISYTGEQWRFGGVHSTVADRLDFQYSLNATDLSTGTYLDANALDFNPPVTTGTAGALDGNAAANRTAIASTINGLSIPAGATFFIRLNDVDATGADDGLAIDDFSITANGAPPTPTLSINDVSQDEGNAGTTNFNFTVSLSAPAGAGGVSFTVNTADGTATAPSDYTAIVNGAGSITQGSSSTQVNVQVNGDATTEPNETFFVNITNVSGATVADGQGLGTIQNDDITLTPIYTIQGSGTSSPVAGQSVTTTGIVTGIKAGSSGGFFIQDPTGDGDPNTSDGVFVFTGATVPAGAVVGNNVRVSGTVSEFVFTSDPNSPPITELSSVTSTVVLSTGNSLPAPHTITAAETTAASGTTNPLDSLEEFEGMRVTVPSLTVVAPTAGTITEPSATVSSTGVFYGVVAGVARPFREAGVNISDTLPGGSPANVPRFDENPERIRVDSDGQPGTTAINVSAGTTVSNVTGPLDYSFRAYTILPDTTLTGTNGGATPAPTPNSDEFTVASFNMERFFDTSNDPNTSDPVLTTTAFNNRLNKASLIIRNVQRYPDVIGVEEVENLSTLQAVAAKVNADAQSIDTLPDPQYTAYLVEGNDIGGIDVGFLVKQSRVSVVDVTQIEQPGCDHVTPSTCNNYTNPNDGTLDILNDRPPLVLRATIPRPAGGTTAFTVIVNHLRSLNNIDDATPQGSGTVGARVRTKRQKGAEFLANYIQSRQTADPNEKIITVGDLNALRVNDGYADVIGTILGTPSPDDQTVVPGDGADLVNPNQTDLVDTLPADQRYSYTFDGNAQTLDHVILNPAALAIKTRFAYAREDADQPVKDYEDPNVPDRISDHDQPVAYFSLGVPPVAGSLIISEFRFRGPDPGFGDGGGVHPVSNEQPAGPNAPGTSIDNDEFIELYNNTDSDITVSTLDGSPGWAVVAADGVTRFIIPNDTVIPARGHFLGVNTDGYSLGAYGTPDEVLLPSDPNTPVGGYTLDIPDGSGIALFGTADPANYTLANRLDAAGYATVDPLYREGTGFPAAGAEATSDLEYSFVRRVCVFGGTGCGAGLPKDTSDNGADFVVVNTVAAMTTLGAKLGAPGPEGLTSPLPGNAQMPGTLLDPSVSASQAPNRVRDFGMVPNGTFGTLSIRRTITNNTGATVRYLAFRVIDITTNPAPAGTADLRALDSEDMQVMVNGNPVDVLGTFVEQPPNQPNGGGLNSSMAVGSINLETPLNDGDSVNVQFLLGIQQTGGYRFYVNIEMINDGLVPERPAALKRRKLQQEQQERQRPRRGIK